MPRTAKTARLYRRADDGRYIIRDGSIARSTGTRDRREAEAALAKFIAEKGRPTGPATPDKMTVAAALSVYGREHAPHVKDPARIGYAIGALVPILGDLPVGSITGAVCRRYDEARGKAPGTIRKELGVLQAAINHCHAEGHLTYAPKVRLPAKSAPRERWLTRDEAARLLWAAHRSLRGKHLARFILVALYTGTRSDAILRMRFHAHNGGRLGRYQIRHDVPPGHGASRNQEASTASSDPASVVGSLTPMGKERRALRRGDRRPAGGERQERLETRSCGFGHRPLQPVTICGTRRLRGRCSAVLTNGMLPDSSGSRSTLWRGFTGTIIRTIYEARSRRWSADDNRFCATAQFQTF